MIGFRQLTLLAAGSQIECLEEVLILAEAQAVTFAGNDGQTPIFEPPVGAHPIWPQTIVQALFCDTRSDNEILADLATSFQRVNLLIELPESLLVINDQDWVRVTLDQFKPMEIGKFWVEPSWCKGDTPVGLTLLKLDPGLAFGTGMHPTTQLCLEWLSDNPTTCQSVIDFGCGSGILAIAAGCLGANFITGLDIDPQALIATKQNASLNKLAIETLTADELPSQTFDLVIANILANPLIELARDLTDLMKPNGVIVMAGLLDEQALEVRNAYPSIRFDADKSKDGWTLISGTRILQR